MSKKRKSANAKAGAQKAPVPERAAASEKIASKKAVVLATPARGRRRLAAAAACLLLLAAGIYFVLHRNNAGSDYIPALPAQAGTAPSKFSYPVADFADGNARFYEYKSPGITIRYFILKSSDGVIRAAFDACDVCWREGKGYYQLGDLMICRNCGQKFPSVKVNEVKGGCNPSPLKRSIQGDKVIIQVADILEGSQYFNLPGRI